MLPPQTSALPDASHMHTAAAAVVSAAESDRYADASVSAPAADFSADFNGKHHQLCLLWC